MRHSITLLACKNETVVTMDITDDQAAVLKQLSDLTKEKSQSPCQPVLIIDDTTTLTVES